MATTTLFENDRLANLDFVAHNHEVRELWERFRAKNPPRVPVIVGTNTRYFMFDHGANNFGMDFRQYSENPDAMFDAQLRFSRWNRHNLLQDAELGPPETWGVWVDFQNYYEAAWFGCPVEYMDGQVPDTHPVFADSPERVMEQGSPDPFGGLFAKGLAFYEQMVERAKSAEFLGIPVTSVGLPGCGSDGPMTVACNLFGPEFVCTAMVEEPDRLNELLTFITDATIARLKAWRAKAGIPVPQEGFGMADDSIALISTAMYKEHILPHHRRLYDTFGFPGGRSIHLCGNATRHFPTIVEELGVDSFDTGFPVDFGPLRRQLGPDILIQGGPHVEFLLSATPEAVCCESRRILQSGILEGKRFVLREGNNLAPQTPLENIEAMVAAGKEFGRFD